MGMDLIVHILIGPTKITNKRDIARAVKQVKKCVDAASMAEDFLTEGREEEIDKDPKKEWLLFVLKEEQYDSYQEAGTCIESMANSDPKQVVQEFVDWWNSDGARDTVSRQFPNDRKKKIVVCGESSYGGTPEGDGFRIVRESWWYNLPLLLGVT
jgi:Sec-independent protein translocase protein TatA